MGCASSKKILTSSPPFEKTASSSRRNADSEVLTGSFWNRTDAERNESGESKVSSSSAASSGLQSYRLGNLYNYIEGEQVVAGWPSWLTNVAKEAIYGWVPLRAESYQKLEKIGQGTYSNVFKARDLDTGKIVALKKVRFDNFEPESVKFMAREIIILRKLNHPNVVKLEGLITSRLSCTIYLVFEYMEHDLAGLLASPDVKLSESQVKCYMHQLLSGLEHCHSHGVMHRDLKCANLLVNNEGILKIADFGLANFCNDHGHRQPLTSRVVTLWYRPPELLLGSTDYEATVDLWSVGCVFAEIFLGRPVLQARTEVEQMHRIFKLCGSPPEEYWRKNRLPHATLFKPQQPYEKCLREKFRFLTEGAFRLLETLLSIEPHKRGTCKRALLSEYFKTKPFACEPSSLPKYSPSKELDAKTREDSCRIGIIVRDNEAGATKKPSRTQTMQQRNRQSKLAVRKEDKWKKTYSVKEKCAKQNVSETVGERRLFVDLHPMPTINCANDARQSKQISQRRLPFSGPLQVSDFSGLVWARKQEARRNSNSRGKASSDVLKPKHTNESKEQPHAECIGADSKDLKPYDMEEQVMLKKWIQEEEYHITLMPSDDEQHQERYKTESSDLSQMGYKEEGNQIELSGQLTEKDKMDNLLERHEGHIRNASWFQRG